MKKRAALALMVLLALCPLWAQAAQITLTFAGDCVLGADQPYFDHPAAYPAFIEKYGYGYPFEKVKSLFENDDLTMVNLEGVLTDAPFKMRKGLPYHFRGPTDYTEILKAAGIEAVNLGNNHTNDFGPDGLGATKAALKNAGIGYCVDRDIYYFEKDGITIAVLGFFKENFNLNRKWVAQVLPGLKEAGADFVIVHLHSGVEYDNKHSPISQSIAHRLIDLGADLIVGHHPHVLQGLEIYKNRLILYSLGNFSFGGTRGVKKATIPSLIARVEVAFEGKTFVSQQLTLHPARATGYTDGEKYQPLLVTGEEAQNVMKILQKDTKFTLNPFIEGQGAVQEPVLSGE